MTTEDLLHQYQGHNVPQTYNAGFVALSFVVSLIGAGSTLELINRRTGFNGFFNHLLLVSSAVTMGGVSIWCMHFIGNRAITLAAGEAELQISYSAGFTALSFFVPIIVLLAAFVAIGSNNDVSWWRVSSGGVLCGAAVSGMHYLGNASIQNYRCVYKPANVAGAAVISVAASSVALSMFFVFRAMWANSWWKRAVSAVILAGAVSGMHWCAAVGTRYRLLNIPPGGMALSRNITVIVVICLSVTACLIIAGSAILKARNMSKMATKAQQISLGAAVFDKLGRILVDTDGLIPSIVVTDSFLEKSTKEGFTVAHPLFHWMFQASRSWSGISSLVGGMKNHLEHLPRSARGSDGKPGIELVNVMGELIEDYDVIFRELFCTAAVSLAERLKEQLTSAGLLWDEILPTGASGWRAQAAPLRKVPDNRPSTKDYAAKSDDLSLDADGNRIWRGPEVGRGSLMFLVRRVDNDRDADRLAAAGYRFADLHQVTGIIKSRMQIQSSELESKLKDMAAYADQQREPDPGLHLGFFGIRARVNGSGFDVLVRKGARDLLPSMSLGVEKIEPWHLEFLGQFAGLTVSMTLRALDRVITSTARETWLASRLSQTLKALRASIQDPIFDDATLMPKIVNLPQLKQSGGVAQELLAFGVVIPIHNVISSPNCEFTPLNFFKVNQLSEQHQLDFTQGVHREFGPVINSAAERLAEKKVRPTTKSWRVGRSDTVKTTKTSTKMSMDGDSKLMPKVTERRLSSGSAQSGSTANLYRPDGVSDVSSQYGDAPLDQAGYLAGEGDTLRQPQSYGGILVSQEITVNVEAADAVDDEGQGGCLGRSSTGDAASVKNAGGLSGKASTMLGIELKPMGHVGTNIRTGRGVTSGRPGDGDHLATFVDILFAQCVEGR